MDREIARTQAGARDREYDRDLHARLLDGDPIATAEFAERYLDPLADWLRARHPNLDRDLCDEAAEEAVLKLMQRPASYDPARATLIAYLRMSAMGDLRNSLSKERRRAARQVSLAAVELSPADRKYLQDDRLDPVQKLIEREDAAEVLARIPPVPAAVRDGLTAQEARALTLMRLGERRSEAYAQALGLAGLPVAEQRRAVKRVKDRLHKRLERAGGYDGS